VTVNTDDLIEALAGDVRRVPAGRAAWRVACCSTIGLLAAISVVWLTLGFRPDLSVMTDDVGFLMRQVYALSIAGFAALLLLRLGQPGAPVRLPILGLAATGLMILIAVVLEQSALSGPSHVEAWLGQFWRSCTLRVAGISLAAGAFPLLRGASPGARQADPGGFRRGSGGRSGGGQRLWTLLPRGNGIVHGHLVHPRNSGGGGHRSGRGTVSPALVKLTPRGAPSDCSSPRRGRRSARSADG
jgi:hypothetical protein